MKEIELTQGYKAIVDDVDYERISVNKYHAKIDGHGVYAKRTSKSIGMHVDVLGSKDGFIVDHINGDTLDNRRDNLRHVTASESAMNRRKRAGCSSEYKGVNYQSTGRGRKRWIARIQVDGKRKLIGRFLTEIEAAIAYNKEAMALHGQYAVLNNV